MSKKKKYSARLWPRNGALGFMVQRCCLLIWRRPQRGCGRMPRRGCWFIRGRGYLLFCETGWTAWSCGSVLSWPAWPLEVAVWGGFGAAFGGLTCRCRQGPRPLRTAEDAVFSVGIAGLVVYEFWLNSCGVNALVVKEFLDVFSNLKSRSAQNVTNLLVLRNRLAISSPYGKSMSWWKGLFASPILNCLAI